MADWFESHDPRFDSFVLGNAPLTRLASGFKWVEGPVWFGDAGCLLFSDIPNNVVMRWTPGAGPDEGSLSTYRSPSNFSNGHTRDCQGRLISCEHGLRRVTRTEYDGSITVLASHFEGKRLNSPNDVVVKSDGSIWFTDPHYGIMTNYEGFKSAQELPCQVYRINADSLEISVIADDFDAPNGLAFSPDESKLYIAETGFIFDREANRRIRQFDVPADGNPADGKSLKSAGDFYAPDQGLADGFRLDDEGNVWTSAGDGVHCVAPDGQLLGKIPVPETVSNLCFGGRGKSQLFITASTSIYSVFLNRSGAL